MNQNFTLPAFAEPITGLPDTPTCAADELKRRFQAPADEVREAHNALAEAHEKLDEKVEGIVTETFAGAIHESMFDGELTDKLNSKADQTALDIVDTRLSAAESTLQTQTNQIAQKCQVYIGTYTGNGEASQFINLGFTPKAVLVLNGGYSTYNQSSQKHWYGGLAITGRAVTAPPNRTVLQIETNGFRAYSNDTEFADYVLSNSKDSVYHYLAFR